MPFTNIDEIKEKHEQLHGASVPLNDYGIKTNEIASKTSHDTLYYAFDEKSHQGPTTKNLLDRMQSLTTAGLEIADIRNKEAIALLNNHFITITKERWGLDNAMKEGSDKYAQLLEKVRTEYAEFLQNEVIPEIIEFTRKPDQTTMEAIQALRQAEIDYLSKRGRPPLYVEYNVPKDAKHNVSTTRFSYQKSIGRYTKTQIAVLKAKQDPMLQQASDGPEIRDYTHTCYKRNTEGRASFSKQVTGRINAQGKPEITMQFYRGSSNPAVDIQNGILRMATTIRTVQQNVENITDDVVAKEMAKTSKSAEAIAKQYNSGHEALVVPVDELRLLSVLNSKIPSSLDAQKGYQQTLETYLAYSLIENEPFQADVRFPDGELRKIWIKPDISLMDFGVNSMRWGSLSDPLQSWINTQGINKLYADTFKFLGEDAEFNNYFASGPHIAQAVKELNDLNDLITLEPDLITSKDALKKSYIKLQNFVSQHEKATDPESKKLAEISYKETLVNIKKQLKEQHKLEQKFLKQRHKIWQKHKTGIKAELQLLEKNIPNETNPAKKKELEQTYNILDNFNNAEEMFIKKNYNTAKNNYYLQSSITRLNYYINRNTIIGCNDDKDRGGRLANTIESDDEFRERHGHSPRFDNKQDREISENVIQPIVHTHSTSYYRGGLSAPGAVDFEIHKRDGNAHLPLENSFMAQLGKNIFSSSKATALKELFTVKILRAIKNAIFASTKKQNETTIARQITSTTVMDEGMHADVAVAYTNTQQSDFNEDAPKNAGDLKPTGKNASKQEIDLSTLDQPVEDIIKKEPPGTLTTKSGFGAGWVR